MYQNAVEVANLKKGYDEVQAVDGASFSICADEVFGLLGPNGAGKTTAVECILGLRQPDSGRIQVLGMEHPGQSRQIKTRVGAQLQSTGIHRHLNVREVVDLFGGLYPRSLDTDELLEMVGLREKAKARTSSLSGGQGQRLAVALALVNDPDLVLLDEPTAGLDPQSRRALWDVIRDLRQSGKAVLLTTHYMDEAEQLCDRVAVMDHGRIIALDTPLALINQHFQETAIEFAVRGEQPRQELAALPAVSQTVFENGRPTLYSTDVPRTMSGLFDLSAAGALDFEDMTVRQATLEDVFLKLTGRRIRG